jgi:hypothetical protein
LYGRNSLPSYIFFWKTERPLEGFHIVVDAGNGAGGFFAVRNPFN